MLPVTRAATVSELIVCGLGWWGSLTWSLVAVEQELLSGVYALLADLVNVNLFGSFDSASV